MNDIVADYETSKSPGLDHKTFKGKTLMALKQVGKKNNTFFFFWIVQNLVSLQENKCPGSSQS